MKQILISGSNGFIATNFIKRYSQKYVFTQLSQNKQQGHITYDELEKNPDILKNIDIILNLAGANIGDKKWTSHRKQQLLQSRINTTQQLVTLAEKYNPKLHFISASAIGIYPPNETCDENTFINYQQYTNFSQEITRKWESAANKYPGKLTITRFGVVLAGNGGAWPKMLQPFKMYVGGKIGAGTQYFSWIALPDLLTILDKIIENSLTGIYNCTAPDAITNTQLSMAIAKQWQRPNLLPLPAAVVKLIFGQMGEELFLNSLNVIPTRLIKEKFAFEYPDFKSCIQAIYNKKF